MALIGNVVHPKEIPTLVSLCEKKLGKTVDVALEELRDWTAIENLDPKNKNENEYPKLLKNITKLVERFLEENKFTFALNCAKLTTGFPIGKINLKNLYLSRKGICELFLKKGEENIQNSNIAMGCNRLALKFLESLKTLPKNFLQDLEETRLLARIAKLGADLAKQF